VECHERLRGIRSSAKLSYWRCCAWNSDIRQSLNENIQASLMSIHLTRPSLSPLSHFSFQPAILLLFIISHHTSILLPFVLEDTKRQYYLLANPLSPGPSSDGTRPRHTMVEQGIRLAQVDSTCQLRRSSSMLAGRLSPRTKCPMSCRI